MVKSLLPVYGACTQLLVYVQSLFLYYSQHPICILYFRFIPSFKYPCYYLGCMCDEVECMMAAALRSFWLLLKGNYGNFSEILEQFSSFLYVVDQLCHYSETIFPQQLSTSPATSSSPVAFLSFISFITFTTSLHNI